MGQYGKYGPLVKYGLALIAAFWAGGADAACRLALLLALDVSGSVDEVEYTLQLGGVARALEDPAVQSALFDLPESPVSLAVFEWSASSYQREIVGWTTLTGPEALGAVTTRLRSWQRATAPEATGIGGALNHAGDMLATAPFCWKQTIDISGDGKNNDWPVPRDVRGSGQLANATINALVIGQELLRGGDNRLIGVAELSAYFRANVIKGPDAFVEVALGFDDYANAMTRKLLRELSSPPLGWRDPRAPTRYAASDRTPEANNNR